MTARGGRIARSIQGGRRIVGDYWQDQHLPDGIFALRVLIARTFRASPTLEARL